MPADNNSEGLKRVIGVTGLAANTINNTIGAGIYALPAIVCISLGAAGILDYLFCGVVLVAIILCYIEIGSRVTATGGSYVYVETAFGPFAGFLVNWLFFFGWGSLGSAALMNVMADSLSVLFPAFAGLWVRALLFFILLGLMVWINVRGAKNSVRFLEYVTIIKLIPLLGIILFGFTQIKSSNLYWQHLPPLKAFGDTALVLFFAFAGFETSLNVSGEIKDPKRTIPRGIILGGGVVFIMYILIQTITQGALGASIGQFKAAPLAAIAQKAIGPIGATMLVAGAVISILGNTTGDVLQTPRLLFAGANDGLFPKPLAKVHPKYATPYIAVIAYASLIFIFSVCGGFKQLAVLASCALLLIYLGVISAMIKLRRNKAQAAEKSFKVPGGLVIPFIAIAAILWLLTSLKDIEIISTVIFLAIVSVIYFLMRLFKKKKRAITS